jgi:putative transposase
MITRRCTQRMFLLRPDAETTNAFVYCLAYAAHRTEVKVFFFLAMSNHYHAGIVDSAGRLPEFLEVFHKLLAKHQNVLRGRWENFWAAEQTSAVELISPEDTLAKMVYGLVNPVKDHLVERADQWPGACSLRSNLTGTSVSASRPSRFFRADGEMPQSVSIVLERPPGHEHLEQEVFAALLRDRVRAAEVLAAEARRQSGVRVLGRAGILRQDWRSRPRRIEPRRQLDPRVASRNIWRRVEALARNRAWLVAYRAARILWSTGAEALFPFGTYWLRRFGGIPCATAAS